MIRAIAPATIGLLLMFLVGCAPPSPPEQVDYRLTPDPLPPSMQEYLREVMYAYDHVEILHTYRLNVNPLRYLVFIHAEEVGGKPRWIVATLSSISSSVEFNVVTEDVLDPSDRTVLSAMRVTLFGTDYAIVHGMLDEEQIQWLIVETTYGSAKGPAPKGVFFGAWPLTDNDSPDFVRILRIFGYDQNDRLVFYYEPL